MNTQKNASDHYTSFKSGNNMRSEEHTSELQSPCNLVCRLLLEKKKIYRRRLVRRFVSYTHQYRSSLSPCHPRSNHHERRSDLAPAHTLRLVTAIIPSRDAHDAA